MVTNKYWFDYQANPLSLAANASGTCQVVLDTSSDFEFHFLAGTSSLDNPASFSPNNFSVQMFDSTQRYYSNLNIPANLICQPLIAAKPLREPMILGRGLTISFNVTNLVANTATIYLVMSGYKLVG